MASMNNDMDKISEDSTGMEVLQGMLNDIRESTAYCAQTSNDSSPNEDFLLQQAIALTELRDDESSIEVSGTNSPDTPSERSSETLVDGLISSGKCISLALNNQSPPGVPELGPRSFNFPPVQQTSVSDVNTAQPSTILSTAPVTTNASVLPKKPHIMISYNRSCQEMCKKIRRHLRALKYIVWMDVYDMRGNFIEGMARAIQNSYIVLMCLNKKYDQSYWCRKEAEDTCVKQLKFIPCFMEDPYTPEGWLALLLGANIRIDFSDDNKFDESFHDLLKQITFIEEDLATNPRESPLPTPTIPIPTMTNPNGESFDSILRNFKTWVEANRDKLKRTNREQSARLINELIQGLENDPTVAEDVNKRQLLQQLLSSTSQNQVDLLPRLVNNLTNLNPLAINGLLFIMALWAVRVVFKKN